MNKKFIIESNLQKNSSGSLIVIPEGCMEKRPSNISTSADEAFLEVLLFGVHFMCKEGSFFQDDINLKYSLQART